MKMCSIASGSSGNCVLVGSNNHHILVDVGISGKRIETGLNALGLSAKDMDGIFITHEHKDHVQGLGVMARRYGLPIYGSKGTIEAIKKDKTLGTIDNGLFHELTLETDLLIGDVSVEPIRISHDAAEPVMYKMKSDGKSAAVVTDLGVYNQYLIDKLQGLDVILLEANHDIHMLEVGTYPYYLKQRILGDKGHLSNEASGRFLGELLHDHFHTVMLGHLSKENNYEKLAYETVRLEVTLGNNPYKGSDFPMHVAKRDTVSDCVYF